MTKKNKGKFPDFYDFHANELSDNGYFIENYQSNRVNSLKLKNS